MMECEFMASFFDKRVHNYDEHMKNNLNDYKNYYKVFEDLIEINDNDIIRILDLGTGTGKELENILKNKTDVEITCVDISFEMLKKLELRYKDFSEKLIIKNVSYFDFDYKNNYYDYIISSMTMHHYKYNRKLVLYKKIYDSLKNNGSYIEGDYYVSPEKELQLIKELEDNNFIDGEYHFDIPFSFENQKNVLYDSGFKRIEIVYENGENGIILCRK